MKVLVVDDSPIIRKLIRSILEKKSDEFEIVGEARNGKEAIELVKSLSPDIIALDITMPVMGGLDAAEEIKKIAKDSKILLITSFIDEEGAKKANEMGIRHILQKPFSPSSLIETLEKMVGE